MYRSPPVGPSIKGLPVKISGRIREKFAPNKKWAVSPLISPPAGILTATQADKLVCNSSIRRFVQKFNALPFPNGFKRRAQSRISAVLCNGS
jgi:hypothetical protein